MYLDFGKSMCLFRCGQIVNECFELMQIIRWGMAIGIYVAGAIGVWYLRRVDWDYEAKKTLKRLSTTVSTTHAADSNQHLRSEACDEDH